MAPMMFSSVDLPEPDGPSSTQTSPFSTVKFTPRSTSCRASPWPKLLRRSAISKKCFSFFAMFPCPFLSVAAMG